MNELDKHIVHHDTELEFIIPNYDPSCREEASYYLPLPSRYVLDCSRNRLQAQKFEHGRRPSPNQQSAMSATW